MSDRPRLVYGYRFGVLGGVSVQLLNRYPTFERIVDMRVLFEADHGMVARFQPGAASVAESHEERVEAIRAASPDVMVVIDSPAFIDAWNDAGRPGALVLEVHTTYKDFQVLDRLRDAPVGAIVTVSRYMAEELRSRELDQLAPVFVVPNCLGPMWRPQPSVSRIPERPLLWVGKLDSHKRWRTALDIMDEVVGELGVPYVPLMVGGYTAREPEVEELLVRMQRSNALRSGAWWPNVPYDRMPELYQAVGLSGGCMLVTSKNESFGMAVAEGAVMGCPVVAPSVGALPELLPTEALYDPDRSGEAARLTRTVLTDQPFREQLVAATQAKVRAIVDPERSLAAYQEVIDSLTAG